MPRVRQARRCSAHRRDGEPCRNWAIRGGTVCRMHGGAAKQVRHQARVRAIEGPLRIAVDKAFARWRREVEDWQVRRFLAVADWLGISPDKVTPGDILVGVVEGVIPGTDDMPEIRVDRRYGPRVPQRKERDTTSGRAGGPAERRFRDAFAIAAEAWEDEQPSTS
jgi:hypothetical protein